MLLQQLHMLLGGQQGGQSQHQQPDLHLLLLHLPLLHVKTSLVHLAEGHLVPGRGQKVSELGVMMMMVVVVGTFSYLPDLLQLV